MHLEEWAVCQEVIQCSPDMLLRKILLVTGHGPGTILGTEPGTGPNSWDNLISLPTFTWEIFFSLSLELFSLGQ